MRQSIEYSQGHYVLPLPLRKQMFPRKSDGSLKKCSSGLDQSSEEKSTNYAETVEVCGSNQSQSEKVSIISVEEAQKLSKGKYGIADVKKDFVVMPENQAQAMQRTKTLKRRGQ